MYVKLFESILDSTIWFEPPHVFKTFLTLLLLADSDGNVEIPVPALARRVGISLEEVEAALAVLEAPDLHSRTPDQDGRRIVRPTKAPMWNLVNYAKYRNLKNAEGRREYQRQWMQEKRSRPAGNSPSKTGNVDSMLTVVDSALTSVDPTLTGVNNCRPPSTQAEEEAEGEAEGEGEESKEEEVPSPPLASLAPAENSVLPESSVDSSSSASSSGSSSASPNSSAISGDPHRQSPITFRKPRKLLKTFSEGDPALAIADDFIALLTAREPLFVQPDRQKWAGDCAKLIAKATTVGMDIPTLKSVITDALTHDGAGKNGVRYYASPSAFLGEWSNGTDKLNAAVMNWRSRSRNTHLQSAPPNGRDYDVSARSKKWGN